VTEKITEPRYPNFKGIMAAKKKTVTTLDIDALSLSPETVGLNNSPSTVTGGETRQTKVAGEKKVDDGTAGTAAVEFLTAQRLI
jgi:electron transfer flavoprotein beta subunit